MPRLQVAQSGHKRISTDKYFVTSRLNLTSVVCVFVILETLRISYLNF